MIAALRRHWPEYLMEALGLGIFMFAAVIGTAFIWNTESPIQPYFADHPILQRLLMGVAMGLTAIFIVYSPFGKRSGAHINPAVTLTFFRLGKIAGWDALFYVIAQFIGGVLGVYPAWYLLGDWAIGRARRR